MGALFHSRIIQQRIHRGKFRRQPIHAGAAAAGRNADRADLLVLYRGKDIRFTLFTRQCRQLCGRGIPLHRRQDRRRGGRHRYGLRFKLQLFHPLVHLQALQQPGQLRPIRFAQGVMRQVCVDRRCAADCPQHPAHIGAILPGGQFGSQALPDIQRRQLFINSVQRTKLLHQLQRRFLPHPRHAGDVVAGIPLQSLQINQLCRLQAVFFPHRLRGILHRFRPPHFRGSQQHGHAVSHQLQRIAVTGGKVARHTGRSSSRRKRAENIVRLVASTFHQRQPHGAQNGLERLQLLVQLLRHPFPAGLILRIGLMPKGRRMHIKGHGNARSAGHFPQTRENIQKAEDSVGIPSIPRCERLYPIKGAIDYAVAVDHQQGFHIIRPLRFHSSSLYSIRRKKSSPFCRQGTGKFAFCRAAPLHSIKSGYPGTLQMR